MYSVSCTACLAHGSAFLLHSRSRGGLVCGLASCVEQTSALPPGVLVWKTDTPPQFHCLQSSLLVCNAVLPLPTHCDLASRSRSSKQALVYRQARLNVIAYMSEILQVKSSQVCDALKHTHTHTHTHTETRVVVYVFLVFNICTHYGDIRQILS